MTNPSKKPDLDEDLAVHVFTVSAGLMGVCATIVGLVRIIITVKKVDNFADDILSCDALIFLAACLTSYTALRTRSTRRLHNLERVADSLFILGLLGLGIGCVYLTYWIAAT